MLALAPTQRCHREQVLDRLWPHLEPAAAARNLHQTLFVARRTLTELGAASDGFMVMRDEHVVLNAAGPVDVDVLEFERSAAQAMRSTDEGELRAAADLYTGDLLPDLPDAQWLTARRDDLREIHREVLIQLASVVGRRVPQEASNILTRALASNSLHEGAVRAIMVVLAKMGRRSEALARYEHLVEGLLDAYGTDPDPQTVELFRELLTGGAHPQRQPGSFDGPRHSLAAGPADDAREIGYLPESLTSFIGRERELVDVERLLDRGRLLTLTGAGGSGKTRLASEAARRVRQAYPDGVWFVDLAVVGDSFGVADAVAEALGLEFGAAPSREQSLVEQLRSRSLLVVLDNCEHLLSACTHLVSVLLTGCPRVDVLATSREPLHAHGEYTFRVPALTLPSPLEQGAPDLAQLDRMSSVRLFVERAARVRPGFVLDAGNAQAVVELCRRLDGMPLALELAAARTAALEPAEIVQRLGNALSMLDRGTNGVTRHQTLRGTLEWSSDLLTDAERVLLRRLSVFSGGFTLAAVEAVCDEIPLAVDDLLGLLTTLVDKSLVVTQRISTGSRYRQLETVRQFGSENLERAGESGQLSKAHCAYFLSVAVAHNPERATGVVIEQPKLLDSEHDNLRAALRWSCAHDAVSALQLVASLWRFWFVRGYAIEGARWVERALAMAPEPSRPRAAALIGLTGLDTRQGRMDRHRALGAEALSIVRRIGEPDEVVMARLINATLAWSVFDLDDSEQLAGDIRAESIAQGRTEFAAAGSWLLGQCALSREDGSLATTWFETCSSELAGADPDTRPFLPVVTPCLQLVPIAGRLVPYLEETMLLGRRVGVMQGRAFVLSAVGYAGRLSGDLQSAISVVAQAVDHFTELRDDLARAQALHQLGCLHRDCGDFSAAFEAMAQARDLRLSIGDRRGELLSEINIALLQAMGGDGDGGLAAARRCLAGFESAGDQVGMGATLAVLGAVELMSGEIRAAREMYVRAGERVAPWRRGAGWQRLMVAELSNELGDHHRAERETDAAGEAFDGMHCLVAGRRLAALRRLQRDG